MLQSSRIAKFDFWCEYSASNMNPVVVGRTFQRFSRVEWSIQVYLSLSEEVSILLGLLSFQAFPLAVFLALLFVCGFRRLNEVMFRKFDRTEHAFVFLVMLV